MDLKFNRFDDVLVINISGRVDTSTSGELLDFIEENKDDESLIILDFKEVNYISSAGLRVLLTTYKDAKKEDKHLKIKNVNETVYEVMSLSGFNEILDIELPLKNFSIEGLPLIGAGYCGKVYRVNEDTILKLYNKGINRQSVEDEKKYAKEAFLLGIPTAISFEMVNVDGQIGIMFEMLEAKTLNTVISNDLEHLEKYAKDFSDLAKTIHSTEGNPNKFFITEKRMFSKFKKFDWMDEDMYQTFLKIFKLLPTANTLVHGDFHPGNVMDCNNELLFIDMGDFAIGHPLFDITHIFCSFLKLQELL